MKLIKYTQIHSEYVELRAALHNWIIDIFF